VCVAPPIENRKNFLGGGEAIGGGVELGAHLAQRQECLGGKQQHEQAHRERQITLHESQSHRNGDQGNRETRRQFEHESAQKRDSKNLHRADAVVLGDSAQALALPVFATEDLQRAEAADQVKKPGAETLQGLPLLALHGLGQLADEDHEYRDQGKHDDDGDAARQVLPEHHGDEDRCRDHGE